MSTNLVCPKCWYTNYAGAKFCGRCGTPLLTVAPAAPVPNSMNPHQNASTYSTTDSYSIYLEGKRRDQIRNTRIGLLLLSIGVFLSLSSLLGWVGFQSLPIFILVLIGQVLIGAVGGLLSLLGVIFIIIGREAFGRTHANQVIWSIILFIVGNVIGIASSFLFTFTAATLLVTAQANAAVQNQLVTAFFVLLIGNLAGIAISGLAYVLISFSLQEKAGLILLWIGYLASLAIALAIVVTEAQRAPGIIQMAVAPGTLDRAALLGLSSQATSYTTLIAIPRIVYATAYLLAWSVIGSREQTTLVTYTR